MSIAWRESITRSPIASLVTQRGDNLLKSLCITDEFSGITWYFFLLSFFFLFLSLKHLCRIKTEHDRISSYIIADYNTQSTHEPHKRYINENDVQLNWLIRSIGSILFIYYIDIEKLGVDERTWANEICVRQCTDRHSYHLAIYVSFNNNNNNHNNPILMIIMMNTKDYMNYKENNMFSILELGVHHLENNIIFVILYYLILYAK